MRTEARAWRVAALPAAAVLGVALPLAFASHCDQYLYDVRPIGLLPIYATAWLILGAVLIPLWGLLTAGLRALELFRRPPGPLILQIVRSALIGIAAAIIVANILHSLRTWLGTFGSSLPISSNGTWWLAVGIGALAAVSAKGRSAMMALWPTAAVCTAIGALSLAALPMFGWPRSASPLALQPANLGVAPAGSPIAPSGEAGPVKTAAVVSPPTPASRPNVVILTMDALSAQHMSLYGYSRPTTPQLDRFARGAMVFEHAYANANFTTPGIASILTGTRPWTNRALELPTWPRASTRRTSLPAVLRSAGYRLGYVSSNVYAGASREGMGQYFQFTSMDRSRHTLICNDALSAKLRYVCAATELRPLEFLDGIVYRIEGSGGNLEHDPRLALDPAIHWLETAKRDRPLFLWVHLFPPHSPYAAPPPWLGRFDPSKQDDTAALTQPDWAWQLSRLSPQHIAVLKARYDENLAYVDHYAGPFLQHVLQILGPNTVVIVSTDHGESFSHGYGAHTGPGLYNEIIHIPLIIKLPYETAGRRCNAVAQQVDIAPTVAALAGIAPPADWEGRSLLGACSASSPNPVAHRPAFSMNFEQNPRYAALTTGSVAVIRGHWKLIHYMGHLHYPFMPALHDQLYDLATDPDERVNLAGKHPQTVARLLGLIDAQLSRHGGPLVHGHPPLQVAQNTAAP
ncbi:MAG TPA: sulfatase [Steroidobacteraceae bacterium]|nr:sulfatase [Steroidobacteraceae bacterium]